MSTQDYKDIFIFLAGSSPQVITETIAALAEQTPPVYPAEVVIITTGHGRRNIESSLVGRGILGELCRDYAIPEFPLSDESFVIPLGLDGLPLEDIRDEDENARMGDTITTLVRNKTRDHSIRLHCSIAGGRKTMSFYLGAALQLFGRPWDRLYHVLVSPEFESNPEFFYKPRKPRTISYRKADGSPGSISTSRATVRLSDLPFVRIGARLQLQESDFRCLVSECQGEIDAAAVQPAITVSLSERTVHIGTVMVEIVPMQLMIYARFLRQKISYCRYPERGLCLDCTACFIELADICTRPALEAMARDYESIYGKRSMKAQELLGKPSSRDGIDCQAVRQLVSKINRTIREQVEDEMLFPYCLITNNRKYGSTKYGVRAEKRKIALVD